MHSPDLPEPLAPQRVSRRMSPRTAAASALVILAAALAIDLGVHQPAQVVAQSEGNGLDEASVNTFLFDASTGIVRVSVDITLRNATTDRVSGNVVNRRYWDSYFVAVPAGAENIVATRNGRTLEGELTSDPEFPAFAYYDFPLGTRLFSGQSTTINVTYDHLGVAPRDPVPWRVNDAYASFIAFGIGDDGQVTIRIVKPAGYEIDDFTDLTGYEASEPDGLGSITYTRSGLDEDVETWISMSNDDRLVVTELDVDDVDISLRSWPNDDEWAQYAAARIESGIPDLETLIGSDWPVDGSFDVRQTIEPYLFGYAGWFDEASQEIAVGEELDGETIYHELSHAWFNGDLADDRWVTEGLAQVYAAELVRADGDTPNEPTSPSPTAPGAQLLSDWSDWDDSEDVEEFGYNASYWVVDAIADEIGFDALRDVIAGLEQRRSPFDPDAEPTAAARYGDWRRVFDMLVEVGGAEGLGELYSDFVVNDVGAELIAARERTDPEYEAFVERSAPWTVPAGVRHSMEMWEFDDVAAGIDAADEVLTLRGDVDSLVTETGVDHPDTAGEIYTAAKRAQGSVDFSDATDALAADIEAGKHVVDLQTRVTGLASATGATPPSASDAGADDFDTAGVILDEQIAVLERLDTTLDADEANTGIFVTIGLLGVDVDGEIDAARSAIEAGDNERAGELLDGADSTISGAASAGRTRAAIGAAIAALLLVAAAFFVSRRRRRAGSGGGLVDDAGDGRIEFDEDALAGAHLGGVDHAADIPFGDAGQAAGATRVVERLATLGDVGDAVLELDEDVVAVVDADAVPGAEVLIDPDAHDSEGR